jgi:hypothetical protein
MKGEPGDEHTLSAGGNVTTEYLDGHSDRVARLQRAVHAVSGVVALPDGRLSQLDEAEALFAAANELALRSELEEQMTPLMAEVESFPEAARVLMSFADMRSDDRYVLGHGDERLRMVRVDFTGTSADVPEVDARIRPTASGSLRIESISGDEREILAYAGEPQFIVGGSQAANEGLERYAERTSMTVPREEHGLNGMTLHAYMLGAGMRAAWGSGTLSITRERLLGVIFDDNVSGRPKCKTDGWMPGALWASDAATVLAYSIPREAIDEIEILDKGMIASRIPFVELEGESFRFCCQTVRVFEGNGLVRPKKGVVAAALRSLA